MLLDLCYRERALLEERSVVEEIPPSPSGYHVATLPSFLSLTPQPFLLPQLYQKCFPSIIWQGHLILHQVSTSAPHKGFSSLSSYLKYCLWLFSKFSMFPFLYLLKSVITFVYVFVLLSFPMEINSPRAKWL